MGKATEYRATFSGGEVSPLVEGRADIDRHLKSCRLLRNMFPTVQGPATRRGGSSFIAPTQNEAVRSALMPFEFSSEDNTMLEWTGNALRFHSQDGLFVAADQSVVWPNGDFDSATGWTLVGGASIGSGVCTMTTGAHELRRGITVDDPTANTAVRFHVISGAGSFQVGTSAGASDLINESSLAPGYYMYVLTPGAGNADVHFSWVYGSGTFVLDDAEYINGQAVEIGTPYSAVTAEALQGAQSADVMYLATNGSVRPFALTRGQDASDPSIWYTWSLVQVSFTNRPSQWSGGQWPRTVVFFEDRLWWAGVENYPSRIWGSKVADYHVHTVGTNAEDPVDFTIGSGSVDRIAWLNSGDDMVLGTTGPEFALRSPDSREPVTPSNVSIKKQTGHGSQPGLPSVTTPESIVFSDRSKTRMIEYVYDGSVGRFTGRDLTLLAQHLFAGFIRQMAWQGGGASRLWVVMHDGSLATLTYDPVEEVIAFASHPIGGTDVAVESVGAMGNDDGGPDIVFITVARTIDSVTRRYVERITEGMTEAQDKEDAFFVDSGLIYDGAETATISGLDHLEGETVAINGDGAVRTPQVVTGGAITLPNEETVTKAIVGLPFISILKPQLPVTGSQLGIATGRKMIIKEVKVSVYRSATFFFGPPDNLTQVIFRTSGDLMGTSPSLKTLIVTAPSGNDYSAGGEFEIRTAEPLPLTVRSIAMEVDVVD